MNLKTIISGKKALLKLSQSPIPIAIAWELKKFLKAINSELIAYEEIRNQKIKEYGSEISKGKFTLLPENIEKFNQEMIELADKEISTEPPLINIKTLIDYKDASGNTLSLSAQELLSIDFIFVE